MITDTSLSSIRLLLPVKPFALAKSRLAVPHRSQVARQLFEHTLGVALACVGPQQVTVLSSDPTARRLADRRRVTTTCDRSTDLNRSLELAMTDIHERFPGDTLAVMVTDLPHLTEPVLAAVLAAASASDSPRLVVDQHRTGTTFVSVPAGAKLSMVFGSDSAQRFRDAGARPLLSAPPAITHDLDVLSDLTLNDPMTTGGLVSKYIVAVIGGTGPQGKGLAYRFARHGHHVILGSRAAEKAENAAAEVNERLDEVAGAASARGLPNTAAVTEADVVLLAVPYEGHDELVASLPLAGKTVISCVNPLAFDKRGAHGRVIDKGEGSAAESAAHLAPDATVVGAFHNVSAVGLWSEDEFLDEDVIVVGDSAEGKQVALDLAAAVTGRPGIDGGKLRLARVLEPFTAVLISINRKYKTHSGIRVTGLDEH